MGILFSKKCIWSLVESEGFGLGAGVQNLVGYRRRTPSVCYCIHRYTPSPLAPFALASSWWMLSNKNFQESNRNLWVNEFHLPLLRSLDVLNFTLAGPQSWKFYLCKIQQFIKMKLNVLRNFGRISVKFRELFSNLRLQVSNFSKTFKNPIFLSFCFSVSLHFIFVTSIDHLLQRI